MLLLALLRRPLACTALLVTTLSLTQCHQSNVTPALPPESTTGANKSGCVVEGQVLVPRDKAGKSGTNLAFRLGSTASSSNFSLGIRDLQDDSKPFIMLTADSLVLAEGQSYPFTFSAHKGVVQAVCLTATGGYTTTMPTSGTLTITKLDRQAMLLAGRFEFVATNQATGRQVSITQGRFDYKTN
jgi:hypothetical protein